jgi:hypothetical protein
MRLGTAIFMQPYDDTIYRQNIPNMQRLIMKGEPKQPHGWPF